ncbi:GyrI-like domain-containing protein [Maribacter antarcticus]|uniref:GyrI-like domain-containing protein n=1 Tax=Maribacter antarcticus TaxID=505250 RepID=UPI000A016854|nr:GyrI-like domain-containing protein [Maribacter antarcticus]
MSLANNLTGKLWNNFMPRSVEIRNRVGEHFISLQVYPLENYIAFKPKLEFMKYALLEVSRYSAILVGIVEFTFKAGLCDIFDYKGAGGDPSIFQYIYANWLPKPEYRLDNRLHFEVLGANYKNNDSNSEEEIWIPIKQL